MKMFWNSIQEVWDFWNMFGMSKIILLKYSKVFKYVLNDLKFRLTKVKKIWDWSFGCKKALALYTLPVFCYGPIFVHYFRNSKRGFGQFCACTRWQKQWHVCQTHCMEFSNWKSTKMNKINKELQAAIAECEAVKEAICLKLAERCHNGAVLVREKCLKHCPLANNGFKIL